MAIVSDTEVIEFEKSAVSLSVTPPEEHSGENQYYVVQAFDAEGGLLQTIRRTSEPGYPVSFRVIEGKLVATTSNEAPADEQVERIFASTIEMLEPLVREACTQMCRLESLSEVGHRLPGTYAELAEQLDQNDFFVTVCQRLEGVAERRLSKKSVLDDLNITVDMYSAQDSAIFMLITRADNSTAV